MRTNTKTENKVIIGINLTEDFTVACQIYNIPLINALECYADRVIVYQTLNGVHDQHTSLASRIFLEDFLTPGIDDKDRNLKCAHQTVNKDGIRQVLKLIVSKISYKSRKYKSVLADWKAKLKLYFIKPPSGKAFYIELDLSDDFIIMCHIAGFSPSVALQYFVDRVSLPKYLSKHPDLTYTNVTHFFFINTSSGYGPETAAEILKRNSKVYEEEMMAYLEDGYQASLSQADLEDKIRREVAAWRDENLLIMDQLISEGHPIELAQFITK